MQGAPVSLFATDNSILEWSTLGNMMWWKKISLGSFIVFYSCFIVFHSVILLSPNWTNQEEEESCKVCKHQTTVGVLPKNASFKESKGLRWWTNAPFKESEKGIRWWTNASFKESKGLRWWTNASFKESKGLRWWLVRKCRLAYWFWYMYKITSRSLKPQYHLLCSWYYWRAPNEW